MIIRHIRTIKLLIFFVLCAAGGYAIGHYVFPTVYSGPQSMFTAGTLTLSLCVLYWYILSKIFGVRVPF